MKHLVTIHTEAKETSDAKKTDAQEDQSSVTSEAKQLLLTLKESQRKDLEIKFINLYAVMKKNRPFSDYLWLNQVGNSKGIKHYKTYNSCLHGYNKHSIILMIIL